MRRASRSAFRFPLPRAVARRLTRSAAVGAGALLLALAGCGEEDNPAGPGAATGPMTATIDGVAWASDAATALAQAPSTLPGMFIVQGSRFESNVVVLIQMTFYNVDGPGTYPLGTASTVDGGIAMLVDGGDGWNTPLSGAAGTVTITDLTPTRIAGTFAFTAGAAAGNATGNRVVTDGAFDLALDTGGSLPPLPANAGGHARATIGGTAWNAAGGSALHYGGNLVLAMTSEHMSVTISLGSVSAPGTYALSETAPLRTITAGGPGGGADCCWGTHSGASGSVTVTGLSATRVVGTFEATLMPTPTTAATAPLVVAGGTFDLGLP
jgi:hypothetical protein